MAAAVYRGPFGHEQAERLLWRAGFGPRKGEARSLAKLGLDGAVRSLTRPKGEKFVGPAPRDDRGRALAPADAWGHDHLWWLDRMVRTSRPLVERMTLVWHDWFATSLAGVGSQKLMLDQNRLLRRLSLGSFDTMLRELTRDPAMLLWLSGTENTKWSPNENYARELMELFTLGAGRGYTEQDVREQARALTGFDNDWRRGVGAHNFHFDREAARRRQEAHLRPEPATYDWQDAVRLCLRHPQHPSFFVDKLWSYFVPTAPDAGDAALARAAVPGRPSDPAGAGGDPAPPGPLHRPAHGQAARRLHGGAAAGARPRDRHERLGVALVANPGSASSSRPTSPAGTTSAGSTRPPSAAAGSVANYATQPYSLTDKQAASLPAEPQALVDGAIAFWGSPTLRPATRQALLAFATARDGRRGLEVEADALPLPRRERTAASSSPSPPTSRPA